MGSKFAAVVALFASASAMGWFAGAVYHVILVLRRIYPEIRERREVLRHPILVLVHPQYLTPDGRRAHARFLVFAFVSLVTFAIAGLLLWTFPEMPSVP